MNAQEMYTRTVESLKRSIEQHVVPDGRSSQRAFAEAYGFSRQNLQLVLAGQQAMSVELFLRLAAALKRREPPKLPPGLDTWSLVTWLEMQSVPIHSAMYEVNFEDTGIVQNSKKAEILT